MGTGFAAAALTRFGHDYRAVVATPLADIFDLVGVAAIWCLARWPRYRDENAVPVLRLAATRLRTSGNAALPGIAGTAAPPVVFHHAGCRHRDGCMERGLGREYFGYSFVPRSLREALGVILLLVCGLLLFLLTTLWAGTITYTGGLWHSPWAELVYDSLFMMVLVVGISEEVIFRCGVVDTDRRRLCKKKQPLLVGTPSPA